MKTPREFLRCGILLAGIALALQPSAVAEDDPPGRVARMNFEQGSVSFQPGGEGDWVTAVPNRPLTSGDNLWTDRNSRAELHVGSTAIRLGPETSLTFLNLDDRTTQLRLSAGSTILRVRHVDDGDAVEVDTANAAFSVLQPGEYRIDTDASGDRTMVTVWRGRGEVTGGGNSYTVVGGQQARFSGSEALSYDIAQVPRDDDFDRWCFDRDGREERAEASNYVSPEITGYEDLDDYGRWSYAAGYGPVWAPVGVPVGWAPYREGHWVWIEPWGWTWVDDEPWGFAPFHYGRWAYVEERWCWVPGPVVVRPVYAPALVAFVGGPGGFRFGAGPAVAWFPLAPGEVYVPPYRVSRVYVNNVNVTNTVVNVTKVTNVYNSYTTNNTVNINKITYINQHTRNAVTAVSNETFVNARPVAKNVVRVDVREIEQAPVTHAAPAQPVRASVLGAGAPARAKPPAEVLNRQVVARQAPAPPLPPFEQRQNEINARPALPRPQPETPHEEPAAAPRPPTPGRPQEPNTPAHLPESMRPQEPVRAQEPMRPPAPVRPQPPIQTERPIEAPRAEVPRPPQPRETEPRTNEPRGNENERPQQNWSHPLARPVPPVQENPAQAREQQNKFNGWQQQHEQSRPPQNRPAPPSNRPAPPSNRQESRPPKPSGNN